MVITYSTSEAPSKSRFEYWRDAVCSHCTTADSNTNQKHIFYGSMEVRAFGIIDIITLNSLEHHWNRTDHHLKTTPDDVLYLTFTEEAKGSVEQGDRRATMEPGQLMFYDSEQAFRLTFGGPATHLVRIPWASLRTRIPGIRDMTAQVLDNQRPGIGPLKSLLRDAITHPVSESPLLASYYSSLLLDLLTLSMESQELSQLHSDRDLYGRIMNYIRINISDQDLGLEKIAKAHCVSTRSVTRAFARFQTSPMKVVWQERLVASRRALEQRRVRNVSEAALEFGFTDFSHFSKAFRRAFGITPKAVLSHR